MTCLRRITDILEDIPKNDRQKFCKTDFDLVVQNLRCNPNIWTADLSKVLIFITCRFFNLVRNPIHFSSKYAYVPQKIYQNFFVKVPTSVIQEIFLWLPIDDFAPIPSVCEEWHVLATGDEIWRTFYEYRFLRTNPNSLPSIKPSGYYSAFCERLQDPHVGDKVEVAWRGKFRLEAVDVYQGLAWWLAEVVDKHSSQKKCKIRYPGWDSRWDEWVPRSKLRWSVEKNLQRSIRPKDAVEIWCCGATVPGAWLESRVKKVRDGRYCVGRVLSTGSLWVERERLRPLKKSSAFYLESEAAQAAERRSQPAPAEDGGGPERSFVRRSLTTLRESIRTSTMGNSQRATSANCAIM